MIETTYDMKGNLNRLLNILNRFLLRRKAFASVRTTTGATAQTSTRTFTPDTPTDYYFKRFGRRGLGNASIGSANTRAD